MYRSVRRALVTVLTVSGLMVPLSVAASGPALAGGRPLSEHQSSTVNTFEPTGSMSVARSGATATLLGDGEVLEAGGGTAVAELYSPTTGHWSETAKMSTARSDATATRLGDGDVLVAGGCCETGHPSRGLTSAEIYDPSTRSWSATGSLNVGRVGATATLLDNGDVLVAGGACNGSGYGCDAGSFLTNLKSAELYDPTSRKWSLTGSMSAGREFQTATLLANGEVLVTGGFNNCDDDFCTDLKSAQLYDPVTGTWLSTGSMSVPREQQTATVLPNGDVLVAGGHNDGGDGGVGSTYSTAEIYNPIYGRWSTTASMNHVRFGQTATLLNGGVVLVTGGHTSTSEIYEPNPGVWVQTGSLSTARTDQTATLLENGEVLVSGGTGGSAHESLATAEVYHQGAGPLVSLSTQSMTFPTEQVGTTSNLESFTVTNYGTGPLHVSAVKVEGSDAPDFKASNGCGAQPLAPGGNCTVQVQFGPIHQGLRTATLEMKDDAPTSPQIVSASGHGAGPNVWVPTGSMITPRAGFSSTLLADGDVLVAGGEDSFENTVATAEIYDPATGSFSPTGSLATSQEFQVAVRLPDGSVLVAGGLTAKEVGESTLSSAEIYDPDTGIWSPTGSMNVASDGLTATLLDNGSVLVTGFNDSNPELYDPAKGTWLETGPLPTTGETGLATLLRDGNVLLAGGYKGESALYDPTTDTWSATGSLNTSRSAATATLLRDGEVLVVGGLAPGGGSPQRSAELYNPTTGTWKPTSSLPVGRYGQSADLLPDGDVLVAGGCTDTCDSGPVVDATYLYSNGIWTQTASLPKSRIYQSVTGLDNGEVLVAGGYEDDSGGATSAAELYIPPVVSASPDHATPGQAVTLKVNGFYAHEEVVIRLEGKVKTLLARSYTDSSGAIDLTATVPSIPVGTYELVAVGHTSLARAHNTLVVRSG